MQEKVIEAIIALAGVRWMQAEEIQLVLVPRGAMVPGNGCIPDWHQWNAQIRLGGGKWGELAGEGKTSGEAMDALLRLLVSAHKAVDERRAKVLESSALKAQLDAVPTRGVSLGGKEVGVIFDESLPKESDESIALRDIANLLGFIGPPDSPQVVVKAVQNLKAHHLQDLREMSWTSRCATLDEVLTAGRETSSATELWTLLHKMRGADKPTYADFSSAQ